ncbi:hypothetical protein PSACC_02713 [Paramicrosporidium saccamoebae]|uniref:arginine--tRNA ligase n=1 Tax=Paramicrosporidium saccamoebae TaxID=1246581 RepID=A0A2H9TIA5_9FUNG|nr:hypothetical protein PSACC_02713 [Paramicrosporidium saccamoebae]
MTSNILTPTSEVSMVTVDNRVWPTTYILNSLRQDLAGRLSKLLEQPADKIFLMLEKPKKEEHGQFSLPLPQLRLPGNPAALAQDLAKRFPRDEIFKAVTAVGPFLNFAVDTAHVLKEVISDALAKKEKYGCNTIGAGRKVLVEYSSPNIAKPFHAGHLRSTVIGNFLTHLYRANGFETISMNYLGDWGKQYGLLAVGFLRYGSEEELVKEPIRHLFDVYVRINKEIETDPAIDDEARAYFKKMEGGDEETLKLWRRFCDLSIVKYKEIYSRLNVSFDVYSGESHFEKLMVDRIQELKDKKIVQESQGAQIVDLEADGLGKAIVVKKDGTTLYLTRDIAAAQYRFETYDLAKSIYVIAMQQDHHMKQLIRILEMMEKPWADNVLHVNFGMVLGMKTRKGQVVFLEDILDDARDVMHAVMKENPEKYAQIENPEEVADTLAVSAIVIQDMSARRIKDYEFKIERVTKFEGDTGPYLQYAHARLCSIQRKSGIDITGPIDYSLLNEKEAVDLALMIAQYPEIVQEARLSMEPCNIVAYLMGLSRVVSTALDRLWVMGQKEELAKARMALYVSARYTLGNGLVLLGLKPLERM